MICYGHFARKKNEEKNYHCDTMNPCRNRVETKDNSGPCIMLCVCEFGSSGWKNKPFYFGVNMKKKATKEARNSTETEQRKIKLEYCEIECM